MIIGNINYMLNRLNGGSVTPNIAIEAKTTCPYDPVSGNIIEWTKDFEILGAVQNLSGNELVRVDKLGVEGTHRLYVNGKPDITEEKRVYVYKTGKYYRITYVDDPMTVGDFLEIYLVYSDNYADTGGE